MSPVDRAGLHGMDTNDRLEPALVEVEAATTAIVRDVVPVAELTGFFDRAFTLLAGVISEQGATIVGPAFARYHGEPTETADVEVGFATASAVRADGEVRGGSLPGGRVVRVVHAGGFDGLGAAWERLRSWIDEQGLTTGPDLWEVYLTEPSPEMDPADLRTELNWSVG